MRSLAEHGLMVCVALLLVAGGAAVAQQQAVQVGEGASPVQVNVNVQPVMQAFSASSGQLNWTSGVVEAIGTGVPPSAPGLSEAQRRLMARRAAVVDAQRNLAETVAGVHLTSYSLVRNFVLQDDSVRSSLDAFIQGARVVEERELPDGSYQVTVRLGMYGPESVGQATIPALLQRARAEEREGAVPPPVITIATAAELAVVPPPSEGAGPPPGPGAPAPGGEASVPPLPAQMGPFTGLIVDCRGLRLSPAMSPKILDQTGKEIWGTMQIDPEIAIERGIVGYYRTMEDARRSARAGANPLVVRAVGKAGRAAMFQCDAVVSVEDRRRILDENERTRFLEKLNVCFVVD